MPDFLARQAAAGTQPWSDRLVVLLLPVGCDNPPVTGVRSAHLLGEPVPMADRQAALIVFVHDGVYARVTRRDAGAHVGHHGRHEDVAGPFPGEERTSLPFQRYSYDLQLRRGEAEAVARLEGDTCGSNAQSTSCTRMNCSTSSCHRTAGSAQAKDASSSRSLGVPGRICHPTSVIRRSLQGRQFAATAVGPPEAARRPP
jgi:hypothetical protein